MSVRRAFLDHGIGETRAVVTLDGMAERLLVRRDRDPESLRLGAQSIARVGKRAGQVQFLLMPDGGEAVTPLRAADKPPVQGAAVLVEVTSECRAGKQAVARIVEPAEPQAPRLARPAPTLEALLAGWTPEPVVIGPPARRIADQVQQQAMERVHGLPGGGDIAIEPTRALTAIDVDTGLGSAGAGRQARQTNLAAIAHGARLLRLKGLGGLVVFDLVGAGHDGAAMAAAARQAFSPDEPGVAIGPVSRFGLFELALPWRWTPIADRLCDETGALSAETLALALVRRLEDEGRAHPGSQLAGACAPQVAAAAEPWLAELRDRIGARFALEPRAAAGCDGFEVFAR